MDKFSKNTDFSFWTSKMDILVKLSKIRKIPENPRKKIYRDPVGEIPVFLYYNRADTGADHRDDTMLPETGPGRS